MIAYIQTLARDLAKLLNDDPDDGTNIQSRFAVLAEELDRIDPRDFLAADSAKFVDLRRRARLWASVPQGQWVSTIWCVNHATQQDSLPREVQSLANTVEIPPTDMVFGEGANPWAGARSVLAKATALCQNVVTLLDSYGGAGNHVSTRSFTWVKNKELRMIAERDYAELALRVFPAGAWKSTVVLAGGILEAVLYDRLTRSPTWVRKAMAAEQAPKKKGGVVRDITEKAEEDEWKLGALIKVAVELGVLPTDREDVIDQALRDYRNFIHPHKEQRAGHAITDGVAGLAFNALIVVCDHLEASAKKKS